MAWRNTHAIDASFAWAISRTRLNCPSVKMTEVRNSFLLVLDTMAQPPAVVSASYAKCTTCVTMLFAARGSRHRLEGGIGNDQRRETASDHARFHPSAMARQPLGRDDLRQSAGKHILLDPAESGGNQGRRFRDERRWGRLGSRRRSATGMRRRTRSIHGALRLCQKGPPPV